MQHPGRKPFDLPLFKKDELLIRFRRARRKNVPFVFGGPSPFPKNCFWRRKRFPSRKSEIFKKAFVRL
jgi:hypothetical protein